jgi:hypothetical protein
MYRAKTNVKHEMYKCSGNNWSHGTGIVNRGFKDRFGSHAWKPFNRFTTKGSCTENITHNTESAAA